MSSNADKIADNSKSKENKKYRVYFMLLLWLSINLIWLTLHQQPSLNQVNNAESKINYNHTVEVPNILSTNKEIPFKLRCEFIFSNNDFRDITNDSVAIIIFYENNILFEWNGFVGEECPLWEYELTPGTYRIQTVIQGDPKLIEATLEYDLFIFLNFSMEGFVIANMIGLLLVLSEMKMKKNKNKNKKVRDGKWKPKAWDMGDATKEVEVGLMPTNTNEDTIISDEIAKQRKQYEDNIENKTEDKKPLFDELQVHPQEELTKGDDSSLKGKLIADERIQRVSDIYDLMEEK